MASAMDAVFMPVAALLVVFFIVPALIMAPQKSADFATAVSIPNSRTSIQSSMMTFFVADSASNSDESNYKALSYKLSGLSRTLDDDPLKEAPLIFSYLKFNFRSPISGNDFSEKVQGQQKRKRETLFFETKVPVRGGDVGDVQAVWQVH